MDEWINSFMFFLAGLDGWTAYGTILGVLFICGLGAPVPEDITLVAAGIIAAAGSITLWGAITVGLVGVLVGDALLFNMGRLYGRKVFRLPVFRKIFTAARMQKAEKRVIHNSKFICFFARFLPGLRAPIYLMSGILGVRPVIFYCLDGLAALLSVPLWVLVGWWFATRIDEALEFVSEVQIYIFAALALGLAIYILSRKKTSAPNGPR